ARLIRIGRLTGSVEESVSAISRSPEDQAMITPSYTFATPVFGGQAAVALTAIYGRLRTTDDVVTNVPRVGGSAEIRETRFETISDTVTGFGDLSPQVSLRWTAGVHNLMTYATGNIPVGVYFAPLQYGHRTWRVGRRCRLHLFQRADGIRILGGGGNYIRPPPSVHPRTAAVPSAHP